MTSVSHSDIESPPGVRRPLEWEEEMREMVVLQRKKTEIGEEEDERVAGGRKKKI
jgi:hypothetical protein